MLNLDPTTLRFSRTKWISTLCAVCSKKITSLLSKCVVVFGCRSVVLYCYSVWVWWHSGEESLQEMLIPVHHTNTTLNHTNISLNHTNTTLNHTNTYLKQTKYSGEHKPHISTAYSLSHIECIMDLGVWKNRYFSLAKIYLSFDTKSKMNSMINTPIW